MEATRKRKYVLGRVLVTRDAMNSLEREEIMEAISRHAAGDWGQCSPEQLEDNELALSDRGWLHSVYHSRKGEKFWVVTDSHRTETTVMMPEDF